MKLIITESGGGKTKECILECMTTGYDLVIGNDDFDRIDDYYVEQLKTFVGELHEFKVYTHKMFLSKEIDKSKAKGFVLDDVESLLSSLAGDKHIGAISVQAGAHAQNIILPRVQSEISRL